MSTNSHPPENTLVSDNNTNSTKLSDEDSISMPLPRSAWNSQVAYLRVVFRAKKALDRIEKEAGVFKS